MICDRKIAARECLQDDGERRAVMDGSETVALRTRQETRNESIRGTDVSQRG